MTVFAAPSFFSHEIARVLARGMIGLLMLLHAVLAFSSATSLSHDPLLATTHAHAGADTDQDDHGHSHDDFEDEGAPHQHGHNAADHSHDKPNVPPAHAMGIPPLSDQWVADDRRSVYPAPCATLERPPKRLLIV
jgi:ABC-type nickel/cobalt efflux system permease component RcnA